MRPEPGACATPGGSRLPASFQVALCLTLTLFAAAVAAEFSAPTILRPPFPEDVTGSARFGQALALDRATLAVSAPGVRGGTVYIYERLRGEPSRWRVADVLEGGFYLGEENPAFLFGDSLALDGDTLVVGAPGLDSAFIFRRSRRGWQLWRHLRPGLSGSAFGAAVAVSGQRVAVGAPGAGRVLIYQRNKPRTNDWGHTATLRGQVTTRLLRDCLDGGAPVPGFGASVALDGATLAVGAWDFEHPRLPGRATRNNGAYLFRPDPASPTGWRQLNNVAAPFACDLRGTSAVSLSGPHLLWTDGFRWAVYERNRGGPERWGWRTGRPRQSLFGPNDLAVRGNVAAFATRGDSAALVYGRDVPSRDRWGLVARLSWDEIAFNESNTVVIGPREVVTADTVQNVVQIFPRAPILADGFESGDTSAWGGRRGQVEVVGPGLGGSDAALAVTFGGDPRASFVASNRPRREPSLSIRFTLLANRVDIAGRGVDILRLFAGKPILRLRLVENAFGATYTVQVQARTRGGSWFTMGTAEVPETEERMITLEYGAATATGAADARVRLGVEGDRVHQVRNLDMERLLVTRVALGLPAGSPPMAGGTFLIDDFEMHR